ncbi:MAG: PorV/PorQ family protein [Endomicrobiales bacterium]
MISRKIVPLVLLSLCWTCASADPSGTTAADFLNIIPNARAAAMGGGTIAVLADEPSSVMVNPAALAGVTRPWASFDYLALPGDISYNCASFCMPSSVGALGASLMYVPYATAGGFDNTGSPINAPSSDDMVAVLSAAIPITSQLPVYKEYGYIGASLKFMNEDLAYYSSQAIALDVGAIVNVPLVQGLTAGVSCRNIGTDVKFVTETNSLPTGVSYGMAYKNHSLWDMTATLDSLAAANGPARMAAGFSISPVYFVTLRTGYQDDENSFIGGMRIGIGLQFGGFALDYALTPANDFSPSQIISVRMAIGGIARLDTASDYYLDQHFHQACELYYKKDYIEARQSFEEILSIYPDHLPSQKYLAKIIAAVELNDKHKQDIVEEWLLKADEAFAQKDFVTAGKYYNRVLKISADSGMAQSGIDRIHDMINQVKQEKDRRENQVVITKIWNRAISRFHQGDYVRAKDDFKDILYIDPNHTESKKYLVEIDNQLTKIAASRINELFDEGMKLYNKGNYAESIKYFDAVFIAAPHRLDAQDLAQ